MWNHYFVSNNKVYYDQGSEAYILDTGNNDVRSEGMSYGMMICVQTNHKTEFDKIWKWAKNLQAKGIIKRIGPDFGGYWKVLIRK